MVYLTQAEIDYLHSLLKNLGHQSPRKLFYNDGRVDTDHDTFFAAAVTHWSQMLQECTDANKLNVEVIQLRGELMDRIAMYENRITEMMNRMEELEKVRRQQAEEISSLSDKLKTVTHVALSKSEALSVARRTVTESKAAIDPPDGVS